MKGIISLRIDRKPDFFSLLQKRGKYIVLVAEVESQIIGSVSCSVQESVINNKVYPVYYLGDLKVHPAYAGTMLAYRLLKAMLEELEIAGADLVLCTVAEGNKDAQVLLNGRAGFPRFEKIGVFKVYQILPKKTKLSFPSIEIINNSPEVVAFYGHHYSKFSIHPKIEPDKGCRDYVWKDMNEIKAAVTVYDPLPMKQNVVINFPFLTGLLLKILSVSGKLLLLPEIPRKNMPLKILYVRYYSYKPGEEKKFVALIKKIRNDAFRNGFHFVSFTVHEKDNTVEKLIHSKRMFLFQSLGFITSLKNNDSLLKQVSSGIPFEDYSLV